MLVGTGASLDVAGSGTINATKIGGITITGTPSTGYVPTATGSSAATWQAAAGGGSAFPFTIVQADPYNSGGSNTSSWTLTFHHALQASGATTWMIVSADGSASVGTPAGWTVDINQTAGTYARLLVLHKASAGDTTAVFTASSSSFSAYVFELSGSRTLDQSSAGASANISTITPPSITPTAGAAIFVAAALVSNGSTGFPFVEPIPLGNWTTINVEALADGAGSAPSGARSLAGMAYQGVATNVSTSPPLLWYPTFTLFGSGGVAYATFSIK
jgi:hypothetical protein